MVYFVVYGRVPCMVTFVYVHGVGGWGVGVGLLVVGGMVGGVVCTITTLCSKQWMHCSKWIDTGKKCSNEYILRNVKKGSVYVYYNIVAFSFPH